MISLVAQLHGEKELVEDFGIQQTLGNSPPCIVDFLISDNWISDLCASKIIPIVFC